MEKEALVETLLDAGVVTTASKREALLDAGVVTTASKRETLLDAGVATIEEKAYWCPSEHVGALFGNPGCVCNLPIVERLTNADLEGLYCSLEGEEWVSKSMSENKEAA